MFEENMYRYPYTISHISFIQIFLKSKIFSFVKAKVKFQYKKTKAISQLNQCVDYLVSPVS